MFTSVSFSEKFAVIAKADAVLAMMGTLGRVLGDFWDFKSLHPVTLLSAGLYDMMVKALMFTCTLSA